MDINIVDVLFHVPADLASNERVNIEHDMQCCEGVLSAHFVPNRPHM
jgi:hypothetical protein